MCAHSSGPASSAPAVATPNGYGRSCVLEAVTLPRFFSAQVSRWRKSCDRSKTRYRARHAHTGHAMFVWRAPAVACQTTTVVPSLRAYRSIRRCGWLRASPPAACSLAAWSGSALPTAPSPKPDVRVECSRAYTSCAALQYWGRLVFIAKTAGRICVFL